MNVLEKIKKLKEERGWSTYKLAYEAGLTQSTLSNMFIRETCPSIDTLGKICEAFGISLSDFFEEDANNPHLSKDEILLIKRYRTLSDKEKEAITSTIATLASK